MGPFPRTRYTIQPQVPVGIDWSHPISRGLVFYYLPSAGSALAPRDLVRNRVGIQVGTALASLIGGARGKTLPYAAATSYYFTRDTFLEPANTVSLMIFLRGNGSIPTGGFSVSKTVSDGSLSSYALKSNIFPGGNIQTIRTEVEVGGLLEESANFNLTDITKPTLLTLTLATPSVTGGCILYENAVVRGSTNTGAGSITYDTSATGNLIVGGVSHAAASSPWSGEVYMVAIWNRVLSAAEVKQMSDGSPFQMLTPLRTPQFAVKTAAAAGGGGAVPVHPLRPVMMGLGGGPPS